MESGTKLELSAYLPLQSEPKMAKKLIVAIQNHALRDTMKSYNLSKVEISNVGSIIGGMAWDEVSHLGKPIYHYHD